MDAYVLASVCRVALFWAYNIALVRRIALFCDQSGIFQHIAKTCACSLRKFYHICLRKTSTVDPGVIALFGYWLSRTSGRKADCYSLPVSFGFVSCIEHIILSFGLFYIVLGCALHHYILSFSFYSPIWRCNNRWKWINLKIPSSKALSRLQKREESSLCLWIWFWLRQRYL